MSDIVISVENLGKKYRIRHEKQQRYTALRDVVASKFSAPFRHLRHLASRPTSSATSSDLRTSISDPSSQLPAFSSEKYSSSEDFWALKDVSFEIKQGEVMGIIGRNGAGKSTLLKILSRITEPTTGRVRIKGRVSSLLEVGTGFHPELTGRENIYLNGAILGMTRVEIRRKFDEIVAFAEVEKFLDTPVKHYSSGMYVRLAFAVAAHLEPEILVVDEVLAVGDAQFQAKCTGKMHEAGKDGRTVLFVSHNMPAIQALCTKVIFLHQGAIAGFGQVEEWVAKYLSTAQQALTQSLTSSIRIGELLELKSFALTPNPVESGARVRFSFGLCAHQTTKVTELALLIYSPLEARIAILDFRSTGIPVSFTALQTRTLSGCIKALPLVEGEYRFGLYINSSGFKGELLDLATLSISSQTRCGQHTPYAAMHRGVMELEFTLDAPA